MLVSPRVKGHTDPALPPQTVGQTAWTKHVPYPVRPGAPKTHTQNQTERHLPRPTTQATEGTLRLSLSLTSQREALNRNSHPHQKHEEEGSGATLNKLFSPLLFVIRDSLTRCQPVPDAVGEQGP